MMMKTAMSTTQKKASSWLAATSLLCLMQGCHHQPTDAELTSSVQSALQGDNAIRQQPIQVAAQNGVVTLTGNVSDDTASTVAAQDAARVKGVKEVVDQITVAGAQVVPTITTPEAPTQRRVTTPEERSTLAQGKPLPPPPSSSKSYVAPTPTAPPAPTYHDVTAPVGTVIAIRTTEALSSDHSEDGQPFNGTVTAPVVHDGYVLVPAGAAVSGRVIDAKDAGRYKGHSALSVELTAVRSHGDLVHISTEPYTLEGKNRGKNSVEKIGGGAAIGAVLGGIFGGGKGAGIGALAGGGGGAALQGFTHGQQVSLPSESVVRFRLSSPLTVRASGTSSSEDSSGLHRR